MAPFTKNKRPITKKVGESGQKVISAQLQKKMDRKKGKKLRPKEDRGLVLLRHIPKGFFEDQIKGYFAQFGHVTRVRLARSRKTGGSKCFAFIEFRIPEVAKIAAETMDNYLMFQKLVKAHYIPPEAQKYDYFRTKVRRVLNKVGKSVFTSRNMIGKVKTIKRHNLWNDFSYNERMTKALKKLNKMKKKYSDLDLDLDSLVIKPKMAVAKSMEELEDIEEVNNTSVSEENEDKSKKSFSVKKRKLSNDKNDKNKKSKKQKGSLSQLLGDTIDESQSSIDEDYLPIEDYNPNETLEIPPGAGVAKTLFENLNKKLENAYSVSDSDDSYNPSNENDGHNLTLDTDSEFSEDESNETETTEEEDNSEIEKAEEYSNYHSNEKFGKKEHLEDIIQRKPHSGGVTKKAKPKAQIKTTKTKPNKQLNKMKAMMVNEITKNKNLKKVKKSELKMKGKI